jgi:hypothetical protein
LEIFGINFPPGVSLEEGTGMPCSPAIEFAKALESRSERLPVNKSYGRPRTDT